MCPFVKDLENDPDLESNVLVSAEQREILDQVLEVFDVEPDCDMKRMYQNQILHIITSKNKA